MKTIIEQLEALARPVVVVYWSDITDHDAPMCADLETGDVLVWQCNPSGTHFTFIVDHSISIDARPEWMALRLDYFEAVCTNYPDRPWYICTAYDGPLGEVRAIEPDIIRATYRLAIEKARSSRGYQRQVAADALARNPRWDLVIA